MKAIRSHDPTGSTGSSSRRYPTPGRLGEVLIKVEACGITHNELDWPIWTCRAGHPRSSIIPGHESPAWSSGWASGPPGSPSGTRSSG